MHFSVEAEQKRRFEGLVAEVRPSLVRYLQRRTDPDTAEDVLADALLVMWRRADEVPSDAPLPWCYGVARGCLANARRGSHRRLSLLTRLHRERPVVARQEGDTALGEALTTLSDRDREILALWAWEDLEPREIAAVLGTSANAASIRLHRAKVRLRREYLSRVPDADPPSAPPEHEEGSP